jgi:hypothetical protein
MRVVSEEADIAKATPSNARSVFMLPNVRDQRRRAVGAPLAEQNLWIPLAGPASGVPTSDDRCIA